MLTWIEISKSAIEHNIKQFRKLVGRDILLMPVIKSNAYGHGFLEIAKILNTNKEINRICVVNLDEALRLIDGKFTKKPIQILSFFDWNEDEIKKAIKHGVIFPIYSLNYANKLNKLGEKLNTKVKIAIKIDTGTSRMGFLPDEIIKNIKEIKKLKYLKITDIYSHLASSEKDNTQTKKQNRIFNNILKEIEKENIKIPFKHITCSAATIIHLNTHFNAVRFGISLYGLHPTKNTENKIKLKPALSWYTKVIQVKDISKGTKISYGGTFTAKKEMKIAILPIGYFDGYDRGMFNHTKVVIRGQKCPILGRICMNLTIIDVSKIKNTKAGDKVNLIGIKITTDDLAKWANTINYEIVTRINPTIPRIVI